MSSCNRRRSGSRTGGPGRRESRGLCCGGADGAPPAHLGGATRSRGPRVAQRPAARGTPVEESAPRGRDGDDPGRPVTDPGRRSSHKEFSAASSGLRAAQGALGRRVTAIRRVLASREQVVAPNARRRLGRVGSIGLPRPCHGGSRGGRGGGLGCRTTGNAMWPVRRAGSRAEVAIPARRPSGVEGACALRPHGKEQAARSQSLDGSVKASLQRCGLRVVGANGRVVGWGRAGGVSGKGRVGRGTGGGAAVAVGWQSAGTIREDGQ